MQKLAQSHTARKGSSSTLQTQRPTATGFPTCRQTSHKHSSFPGIPPPDLGGGITSNGPFTHDFQFPGQNPQGFLAWMMGSVRMQALKLGHPRG